MQETVPRIEFQAAVQGGVARVLGQWTAAQFAQPGLLKSLTAALAQAQAGAQWDLRPADQLDHVGGQLLWDHWGRKWPAAVELSASQRAVLERVAQYTVSPPVRRRTSWLDRYLAVGGFVLRGVDHVRAFVRL